MPGVRPVPEMMATVQMLLHPPVDKGHRAESPDSFFSAFRMFGKLYKNSIEVVTSFPLIFDKSLFFCRFYGNLFGGSLAVKLYTGWNFTGNIVIFSLETTR